MTYDVIVAGGGCAGVAAAVASARTGAKTLLIERNGCLGGAATMRNVATFCGLYTLGEEPRRVVNGVGGDILDRLRNMGALSPPQRFRGVFAPFDPEALKLVLDELCADAGVEVLFNLQITGAERENGRICSVATAGHGGAQTFAANAFVDCTGDGDLAAFGGAATRYGNPDGVNLGTLGTRFGGIAPGTEVLAADYAQAVHSLYPNGTDVTKDKSVMIRVPISGDLIAFVASAAYDPRDAVSQSRAEANGRAQAWRYLAALRTLPGCENAYLVSTGPEFGTRESRHIEAQRSFTWADIEARRHFDDCIAIGAWGAEWHDRETYKSSFDYPPERGSYQIPLSCLASRDTPNLFGAGRLADGDRRAGAAIRVMGTSLATGQAAGCAAALAAENRFDARATQDLLRAQGAFLTAEETVAA
ncbi:FAD-dependent oxidoreductase [Pseudoruegeria sp. HB172150]|uniref:FAD-dependent oxidoreductase n=1 Tax=Pseudoruegeria sp. HB172150 TaxID=2721164 RepID=UPI001555386C|nr:FAD-dependent oxidoreductase [Pseudoruegeria sp. HB172150]